MKNYTSPHTGRVYDIQTETYTRMEGDWYAGEPLREVTVVRYDFYYEGEKITSSWDLNERRLSDWFGELEGVYSAWETSPRD